MCLNRDIFGDTKWTIKQTIQKEQCFSISKYFIINKNVINVRTKLDKDYETLISGITMFCPKDSVVKMIWC